MARQRVLCPGVHCLVVLQVVVLSAGLRVVPHLGVLGAVRHPGVVPRGRMGRRKFSSDFNTVCLLCLSCCLLLV